MSEDMQNVTMGEAVQWVNDYMQQHSLSQTAMAKEIGCSSSALSAYRSGKYATPEKITQRIAEVMQLNERKKLAPKAPVYAVTTVTEYVTQAIAYAHMRGVVTVAYGDAGVGKTTAVNHYLQDNQLAIGITIIPTYASLTGVNELLSDVLGVRERTDRKITRDIIGKLKDSRRVIIVDEAQHLTTRAIEHLRSISDLSGVGVCFVGNEQIYTKLLGSRKADYAQLFSRIAMKKAVMVSTNTLDDIRRVFGDLEERSLEILFRISRTAYGLRGAVNVYINTVGVYDDITAEHLTKIVRDMNIAA